jgi:hypothetical protein
LKPLVKDDGLNLPISCVINPPAGLAAFTAAKSVAAGVVTLICAKAVLFTEVPSINARL